MLKKEPDLSIYVNGSCIMYKSSYRPHFQANRAEISAKNKGAGVAEIAKIAGAQWKELEGTEEKKEWDQKAAEDKKRWMYFVLNTFAADSDWDCPLAFIWISIIIQAFLGKNIRKNSWRKSNSEISLKNRQRQLS